MAWMVSLIDWLGYIVASKAQRILVTISIDTECDHDPNWVRSNPLTFKSINIGLPDRLQTAFAEVGAVPTYLLTVEVLEDDQSVETLRHLPGQFELGTHLHAAFIEPHKKYHNYAGIDSSDFQCAYPEHIELAKLENLTNLFESRFGYRPTSFRAGRYGANGVSLNNLQKLGYKVDSSVTPLIRWIEPNAVVDFRKAPQQPYFPAENEIVIPGDYTDSRILEVPITVRPRTLRRNPIWFRPWFASVDQMKQIFRYHLKQHPDRELININMMFHSMEVIEKASPYPQTREQVQRFLDDMVAGLDWCRQEGAEFCGLTDLHETYRQAA